MDTNVERLSSMAFPLLHLKNCCIGLQCSTPILSTLLPRILCRPFARKLPEFKFWHSCIKSVWIAFLMTFFTVFDVPVFWPILLIYFLILFVSQMRRQIRHMIKHRYVPFSWGKTKYKAGKAPSKAAGKQSLWSDFFCGCYRGQWLNLLDIRQAERIKESSQVLCRGQMFFLLLHKDYPILCDSDNPWFNQSSTRNFLLWKHFYRPSTAFEFTVWWRHNFINWE